MLIVLLPEELQDDVEAAPEVYWWRLERDGSVQESGCDSLAQLRSRFAGQRLRALAPGTAVSLYRLDMPVRRTAAVRAALPFALEDQLSQVGQVAAFEAAQKSLLCPGVFAKLIWPRRAREEIQFNVPNYSC